MAVQRKELVEFGPFRLDPAERLLAHNGKPIALTPKAFETLMVLVENAGHALDKDELLKRLWPGTFVEEATLAKNISTLRKALGDGENGSRYIETIPKFGYRFVAPVNAVEQALDVVPAPPPARIVRARGGRWAWAGLLIVVLAAAGYFVGRSLRPKTATSAKRAVLMVLPFEDLSGSREQEYLGDGLTAELISQLSRMNPERLAVIARTTAMRYKATPKSVAEIGRELGVNYIVEGSFRREGNWVRITAQLVQTSDQTYLWAETYERQLQQVIPLQREVSYAVARGVAVEVSPPGAASRRAANSEAYDDYLRARFYWNKRTGEGRTKAREYFNSAIALDEGFAPAYAGLAETYINDGQREIEGIAAPLVNRALELDPTLPEGHVCAGILALVGWRWADADAALRRAIELDPNSSNARMWYAVYLRSQGRLDQALAENERALKLDPLSSLAHHEVGVTHYLARRYDRAITPFRRALEIEPAHHWTRLRLAQTFALQNMAREVEAEIANLEPDDASGNPRVAHLYAVLGQPSAARKILALGLRDPDRANPYDVAATYAALGEPDRAFQFLEPARLGYTYDATLLKVDQRFDPLRADLRFAKLLRALGLQ